jgi:tetratricopeptide (TPR) repeat protein
MHSTPLRVLATFLAVVLHATGSAEPADSTTAARPIKRIAPVTILIAHAVDASINGKDAWLGAILEATLRFKLGAIPEIRVIGSEGLSRSGSPGDADVRAVARQKGVSLIVTPRFEILKDGSVQYLMEIVLAKDGSIARSIEWACPLERLQEPVDTVLRSVLTLVDITAPAEAHTFLRLPAAGSDPRNFKALGAAILKCTPLQKSSSGACADEFLKLAERDRTMYLAQFLGAQACMAADRFGDAAVLLDPLLAQTGTAYPDLFDRAAGYYRQAGRLDDALRIAILAERLGVSSPGLRLTVAQTYAARGDQSRASEEYRRVLAESPNQLDALLFLAKQANQDSSADSALSYSDRALRISHGSGSALLQRGIALTSMGRSADAEQTLSRASTALPSDPAPDLLMGDVYFRGGVYAKALPHYRRARQKAPNDPTASCRMAVVLGRTGDPKGAYLLMKKVESAFARDPAFLREMGLVEYALRDSTRARSHLESALAGGQRDSSVLIALGGLYTAAGRFDDAFSMLNAALTVVNDKNPTRLSMVRLFLGQKDTRQALPYALDITAQSPNYPEVNRYLGDIYVRTGNKAKALEHYQRERDKNGDTPQLRLVVAGLLFELGRKTEAKTAYQAIDRAGTRNAEVLFRLAEISLGERNPVKAESYLNRGLASAEANEDLWFLFGSAYVDAKTYTKAIGALRKCLADAPDREDARAMLETARSGLARDPSAAVRYYATCVRSSPGDAQAQLWLGQAYAAQKNLPKAMHSFQRALDADKNCRECAQALGDACLASGDVDGAQTQYARYMEIAGENDSILVKLGRAYLRGGKPDKAQQCFEKASSINEKNDEARYLMLHRSIAEGKAVQPSRSRSAGQPSGWSALLAAEIDEARGSHRQALTRFKAALPALGDNDAALSGCGRTSLALKDYASARTYLERAIALSPTDVSMMVALGHAHTGLHNDARAIGLYRRALKADDRNAEAYSEIARIEATRGNRSRAIESLEKALKYGPRSADLSLLLGQQYRAAKRYDDAISAFKQALRDGTQQEQAEACRWIGNIYYSSLKDREKAKEFYRRYVKLGGKEPVIVRRAK